jgi:competence ComEA-like helix-hairpin-helix protein
MWQMCLTRQERLLLLFFAGLWLCGISTEYALRRFPRARQFVNPYFPRYDLNRAGVDELVDSRLISRKIASEIVAYRQIHGPFKSLDELRGVRGIGEYRCEKLKRYFFVAVPR